MINFAHLFLFAILLTDESFEEDNVLDWILELHHGNTMRNASRQSLMTMVENYDYLAVVFCKLFFDFKCSQDKFY